MSKHSQFCSTLYLLRDPVPTEWYLLAMQCACAGVSPVTLEGLVVPPVIQNGTLEHVVLDCPYTLGPGEREGVVLKW